MVPSSLSALVIFLALLGPGYLYVTRLENLQALYKVSPFRETVAIVMASVLCNGVAVVIFVVVRIIAPKITPDVGAIVRQGAAYARANYAAIAYWSLAVYLVAFIVAFSATHPIIRSACRLLLYKLRSFVGEPVLDSRSAWSRLFDVDRDTIVRVACELEDGSWMDGWLFDWNAQPEEDADRTVVLHGPIRVRAAGDSEAHHQAGITFSVVAHGKLARLDVTHVDAFRRDEFDSVYAAA